MGEDNKKNKRKTPEGVKPNRKIFIGMGETRPAKLIDLTAYRLERMLHDYSHDEWMHQALLDILGDYYLGLIAIGWENGEPVVMSVGGDNIWTRGMPPGFSMIGSEGKTIVSKDLTDYQHRDIEFEFTPETDPDNDC